MVTRLYQIGAPYVVIYYNTGSKGKSLSNCSYDEAWELEEVFIMNLVEIAPEYEGVYNLMEMLAYEEGLSGRNEIVVDLQYEIEDLQSDPMQPMKKTYVKFDDLGAIAKDVINFKQDLKTLGRHK